jgi:hypothetical protein
MVEVDESLLEFIWWIAIQPRENDGQYCGEIWLNG